MSLLCALSVHRFQKILLLLCGCLTFSYTNMTHPVQHTPPTMPSCARCKSCTSWRDVCSYTELHPGCFPGFNPAQCDQMNSHLPPKFICQYANSLLPQHFEFFVENEVAMRPPGWALIQDGCCPPQNGKLSHRCIHIERTPLEHEDSYLQSPESGLGQNFLHRPQKEPCGHQGLRLELQNHKRANSV